jgi:hypothetical protein
VEVEEEKEVEFEKKNYTHAFEMQEIWKAHIIA